MRDARLAQIEALRRGVLDILILGGGINGAGTLRDLALRTAHAGAPLRIALIEKNHFASGTSGKKNSRVEDAGRKLSGAPSEREPFSTVTRRFTSGYFLYAPPARKLLRAPPARKQIFQMASKSYLASGRAPSRLRLISSICGCTTWS